MKIYNVHSHTAGANVCAVGLSYQKEAIKPQNAKREDIL